jgi:hypothetical protein
VALDTTYAVLVEIEISVEPVAINDSAKKHFIYDIKSAFSISSVFSALKKPYIGKLTPAVSAETASAHDVR